MNTEEFPNDREVINNMLDEVKETEKDMISFKRIIRKLI